MIKLNEVQVTISGKIFNLSRVGVEERLINVKPEKVTKYGIEIRGQEYPVLQVLSAAAGVPKIECNTVHAYRTLQKLGFEIRIHE